MSSAASRTSAVESSRRRKLRREALMIIRGLRISWAMTVDSPGEDGGIAVDQRPRELDLARQVSGSRDLPHGLSNGRERSGHGASHGVAEEEGNEHAEKRRAQKALLKRAEKRKPFARRSQKHC